MIRIRQLSLKHGTRPIVTGVDAHCMSGSMTAILGPNGAGKSTLLNAVCGSHPPSAGQVCYGSSDVYKLSPKQLSLVRACLHQQTKSSFELKGHQVLEYGTYPVYKQLTAKQRACICAEVAEELDVSGFAERPMSTLSGGEQQRVWLGKCLVQLRACRPFTDRKQVLLLDEPTAALDLDRQARLFEMISTLMKREKLIVLAVMHDLQLASRYADQVILLSNGKQVVSGYAQSCLTPKTLEKTYNVSFTKIPDPAQPLRDLFIPLPQMVH